MGLCFVPCRQLELDSNVAGPNSNRMDLDRDVRKRIVRDIFERGWNKQQFASFSSFIAESVVFNFRGSRQPTDIRQLKDLIALWRTAFPDLHFQVIDVIEEGNLVAANLVFTGTHLGPWFDIPPSGNSIRVEEMMFFRFDSTSIVEIWEVYDEFEMRKQMTV